MTTELITLQITPKQLDLLERALGMAEEVAAGEAIKYDNRLADSYRDEERKIMLKSLVATYDRYSDNFRAMSQQLKAYR